MEDNLESLLLAKLEAGPSRFYFRIFIDIIFDDRAHDRKVSRTGFKAMQVFFEQRAETRAVEPTSQTKLSRVSRASTVSDVGFLAYNTHRVRFAVERIDVVHATLTNVFRLVFAFKGQINTSERWYRVSKFNKP